MTPLSYNIQEVIDALPYPFHLVDANDYSVKLRNAASKKAYGTANHCYSVLYKKDKPCAEDKQPCSIEIIKQTKKPVVLERVHYNARGKQVNVEVHAFPLFDDSGKVTHIIEYAIDITGRKDWEAAIKNSEERFREFFENDLSYCFIISPDGVIINANRAARQTLNYKESDLIGKPVKIIYPSEFVPEIERLFQTWRTEGKIVDKEITLATKKGDRRIVILNASTVRDTDGKALYAIFSHNDVTDRKNIENRLLENEQRYRTLFEESKNIIVITTKKGKIVEVNKAVLDLLGYTSEELKHMSAQDFYANPTDRFMLQQELEKKGEVTDYELRMRKKDGSEFFCAYSGKLWHGHDGRILGYHGVLRDITTEKQKMDSIKHSLNNLQDVVEATMQAITKLMVKEKSHYTAGHEQRVGKLACAIASEMGLKENQIYALRIAAIVHDIGKAYIPVEILAKSGKLTKDELDIVKSHPQASYGILETMKLPWSIAMIVLQHHERMDGSGYPDGLSGDAIMLEARILGVADVVEAMSSYRPYREGIRIDTVLEELAKAKGTLYDPNVVNACIRLFKEKGFTFD